MSYDLKDALRVVHEVVYLFWVKTYDGIDETFWVVFGPRGCFGLLYAVWKKIKRIESSYMTFTSAFGVK